MTCTPSPDVVCYAHAHIAPHRGAIGVAVVALLLLLCVGGPLLGLLLTSTRSYR